MTQKIWKVFVSIALVAVLLLIGAEFGLRALISNQMKKDFAATSSEEPKVSFGPTPLLLSQLTGTIAQVNVENPSTVQISKGPDGAPRVEGTPATKVAIKDLSMKDSENPTAGHLQVDAELTEEFLLAQAQAAMASATAKEQGDDIASQLIRGLIKITSVDAIAAEQAVKIEFTDGAASLTLRPTVDNGALKFRAEEASLLGLGLPSQLTDTLTKTMEKEATELSGLLKIEDLKVEDTKITLRMAGDNVPLDEL